MSPKVWGLWRSEAGFFELHVAVATPLIIARFGIKLLYSRVILVRLPPGRIVRYEIAEASGSAPGRDCSNTSEKVPSYGRSSCPSAWRSCPTTGRSGGGASRILGSESVGWNKRRCGRVGHLKSEGLGLWGSTAGKYLVKMLHFGLLYVRTCVHQPDQDQDQYYMWIIK